MNKFIKLIDNSGDIYYANPRNIAFLKVNAAHSTGSPIYKAVITSPSSERQVIMGENQFIKIKNELYGA